MLSVEFHFGKSWYTPPVFLERVRNGLKAKRLKGKMLCTENERVRNCMKTKDGLFGERMGINTEIAEVTENTEEAQGRAGPPRRAGGRTGRPFAKGALGERAWRLGIMPEDSMFISTG